MDAGEAASRGEVTALLARLRAGESDALDRLLPLVYDELRQLARRQLRRERGDHTLHPTALVHEAYIKLAGSGFDASDRAHLLAIAARAMRQVLVDHARRHNAAKRGGGWQRTTLHDGVRLIEFRADELLALDRALEQLDERQRRVVEYRFFGGLEEKEIAAVLGISETTVRREWVRARAWLYRTLYDEAEQH